MEYIDGESLYTLVKRLRTQSERLGEKVIWNYFAQMVTALQHIFKRDFINGDIKIDNWLVKDNKLWLCDFGKSLDLALLAKKNSEFRIDYKNLNSVTPSPNAEPNYLFEGDLAGLAASLFTMVTGNLLQQSDFTSNHPPQVKLESTTEPLKTRAEAIINSIMGYRCQAPYYSAKADVVQFLKEIKQKCVQFCQ